MVFLITKISIQKSYEEIAEGVEERRQTPWKVVSDFEESLERSRLVLELGCGTSRNAAYLAAMGHEVVALDFSRGMLKLSSERIRSSSLATRVDLVQADVQELPLTDSSIDICLFIAVLHHLPTRLDRLESLMEVGRCLKPGGKALVSVWAFNQIRFKDTLMEHQDKKEGFGDVLVPIRARDGKTIQRFYHLFVEGELEQLVKESGLDIGRCFKSQDNYFVVAVKRNRS